METLLCLIYHTTIHIGSQCHGNYTGNFLPPLHDFYVYPFFHIFLSYRIWGRLGGSGSIMSNAWDMAKWLKMQLSLGLSERECRVGFTYFNSIVSIQFEVCHFESIWLWFVYVFVIQYSMQLNLHYVVSNYMCVICGEILGGPQTHHGRLVQTIKHDQRV